MRNFVRLLFLGLLASHSTLAANYQEKKITTSFWDAFPASTKANPQAPFRFAMGRSQTLDLKWQLTIAEVATKLKPTKWECSLNWDNGFLDWFDLKTPYELNCISPSYMTDSREISFHFDRMGKLFAATWKGNKLSARPTHFAQGFEKVYGKPQITVGKSIRPQLVWNSPSAIVTVSLHALKAGSRENLINDKYELSPFVLWLAPNFSTRAPEEMEAALKSPLPRKVIVLKSVDFQNAGKLKPSFGLHLVLRSDLAPANWIHVPLSNGIIFGTMVSPTALLESSDFSSAKLVLDVPFDPNREDYYAAIGEPNIRNEIPKTLPERFQAPYQIELKLKKSGTDRWANKKSGLAPVLVSYVDGQPSCIVGVPDLDGDSLKAPLFSRTNVEGHFAQLFETLP